MQILDNLIILSLIFLSFLAGMKLANHYNRQSEQNRKDALERQFVRLRTQTDADDPVRPYVHRAAPRSYVPPVVAPMNFNTGDFDGDNQVKQAIDQSFMDHLKTNGRASTKLSKT